MSAIQAVERLLHAYFDMLYFCDVDALRKIFHPQAIYATADEPSFLHRTVEEYAAVLAMREPPAKRQECRRDFIDAVEFAGENTAFARVRCSIAKRDFVDFLTLVRVEGEWQIIAKVFQIIERDE